MAGLSDLKKVDPLQDASDEILGLSRLARPVPMESDNRGLASLPDLGDLPDASLLSDDERGILKEGVDAFLYSLGAAEYSIVWRRHALNGHVFAGRAHAQAGL